MKRLLLILIITTPAFSALSQSLDLTFNQTGYNYLQPINDAFVNTSSYCLSKQSDGKLIVGGSVTSQLNYVSTDIFLTRFNPDGSTDNSFGTNGTLKFDEFVNADEFTFRTLIQPDDKIIVIKSGRGLANGFKPIRLNADGSPDASFSSTGIVEQFQSLIAADAALNEDGSFYVAGWLDYGGIWNGSYEIAKFLSDGSGDITFGYLGRSSFGTPNSGVTKPVALRTQSDGKIVIAGIESLDGVIYGSLFRLKTDGYLDSTFGTNGFQYFVYDLPSTFPRDIIIDPSGRILLCGLNYDMNNEIKTAFVSRFNTDGSPDLTFGFNGTTTITTVLSRIKDVNNVTLDASGRILLSGPISPESGFNVQYGLIRLTEAGAVDLSFGTNGIFEITGGSDANTYDLIWDNAQLYVGASVSGVLNSNHGISLAKVNPDFTISIPNSTSSSNHIITLCNSQLQFHGTQESTIVLTDMSGRIIFSQVMQPNQTIFTTLEPHQLYVYRIHTQHAHEFGKVINQIK